METATVVKNDSEIRDKEKELLRSIPSGKFKSGRVWKERGHK